MQSRCQDAVAKLDNYLDIDIIDKYMEQVLYPEYVSLSFFIFICQYFWLEPTKMSPAGFFTFKVRKHGQ